MKAYKGFDKDLKCKDFQYEIGKTYEEPTAELCEKGFHACEYPLDVFEYYAPGNMSRYCEVDLDDVSDKKSNKDSKRCGKKIAVKAEIGIAGLVKAAVKYTMEKAIPENSKHATGWRGAASATGWQGAASATGTQGAASATGWRGAASATGTQGAASATGTQGAASATGTESVAAALGINSKAKGALGCWIVIAEWESDEKFNWHRKDVQCFKVDGENIKSDTWYKLKNGELVEVSE
nr:MAG TPA: hypothetical protein [Caudoviricetes sp.]